MGGYRNASCAGQNGQNTPAAAWPELFRDGAPLPLAAWPDGTTYAGGFKPAKILQSGKPSGKTTPSGAAASDAKLETMVFLPPDTARAARWKTALEKHGATLWFGGHWYWDWADDLLPAASIGDDGAVTMGMSHAYGMGAGHANLHAFNLVEEMDREGEYALEPAQKRILVLLDPARSGQLTLSWLGVPIISLNQAAFIRMEGIGFADCRSRAVEITKGSDLAFEHCGFLRAGDTAIKANGERIAVRDCVFRTLGGSAARLEGGDRKTLTPSNNVAERCLVENFSRLLRTYAPAFGANGVGCTIANNLIRNAPHSAILFGGNDHRIRDNDISEVLTETGDCGAIYGGRDWTAFGNTVSGNWIHDFTRGRDTCGIYLDDQLSGVTVTGNLVDGGSMGILVGGGRYNTVSGNIFAHCETGFYLDARGAGWGKTKLRPTLIERLKAIPADEQPWSSRYPEVERTLSDRPDLPIGTQISRNALVACKHDFHIEATAKSSAPTEPNFEKLPPDAIVAQGDTTQVTGTPIKFIKPKAGPSHRPSAIR
jgi:parallel beta-helix repeat protein